jgi:hypothetical protein
MGHDRREQADGPPLNFLGGIGALSSGGMA